MNDIHGELDQRYRELRKTRNGPVYFIEHGLDKCGTDRVVEYVRNSLIIHPVGSKWWSTNYLPLIVAATEVGYGYRGTGTDFWPVVENRFGVTMDLDDRHRIRQHFQEASRIHQGAQPPDTPWAKAFSIIVWPITHALLPKEFHRPLALMLKNLGVEIRKCDDYELYRSIRTAASNCSARFSTVIEDATLIVSITRRLLGEDSSELSPEVVDRIKSDIESDHITRRIVSVARRIQRDGIAAPSRSPSPRRPNPSLTGSLHLRRRNGEMAFGAVFPPIEAGLQKRLQQVLRRCRYVARLWGVSTPVPSVQLLSSLPFTFTLLKMPQEGAELLPGVDQMDLEPKFRDILASFELDVTPPLLFRITTDGTHGRQIRGPDISGFRKYWLLTVAGISLRGCEDMREMGPFCCHQLDPGEADAQETLRDLGFHVRYGISVDFAGSPPIEPEATVPVFASGDRRIVVPRSAPPTSFNIQLGEEIVQLKNNNVAIIEIPAGEHSLSVSNDDVRREYFFRGMTFRQTVPPVACSIEPRSVELTVQALLRGALHFDIESFAPLEGLSLTAEIETSDQRIAVTNPLEPLPCRIELDREPFDTLLDKKTRNMLAKAKSTTLRLRVGHLCSYSLELEHRVRPCWWEHQNGKYALISELGALPYGLISAADPTARPVSDSEILSDEAHLLAPIDPDVLTHSDTAQFTTLCVAPSHVRLEPPMVKKPRLSRCLRAGPGSLGLEDMVEGYLRWSLAETPDIIAEMRRRQISRELDSWVTAMCCGEAWASRESLMNIIDPWEKLFQKIEKTGFGRDSYITISSQDNIEVSRIAVRQIRAKMPDLWARVGSTGSLICKDYDTLNIACGQAYAILGERYRKQGKLDIAVEIEGGDPGEAPDEWNSVLECIQSDAELHPLVEMLIPSDLADEMRTLEPSIMSLYELTDELEAWTGRVRRTLAGNVPSADVLKAILALWIEPEISVSLDWRRGLDILLIERSVARAARYLALRSRRVIGRDDHQ